MVGTYEALLWLCEWRLGGHCTSRWWGLWSPFVAMWMEFGGAKGEESKGGQTGSLNRVFFTDLRPFWRTGAFLGIWGLFRDSGPFSGIRGLFRGFAAFSRIHGLFADSRIHLYFQVVGTHKHYMWSSKYFLPQVVGTLKPSIEMLSLPLLCVCSFLLPLLPVHSPSLPSLPFALLTTLILPWPCPTGGGDHST